MFRPYDARDTERTVVPDDDVETLDLLECRTQTATLALPASDGYRLFSGVQTVRQWARVARSVRIVEKYDDGRPARVSFLASVPRGAINCTVNYRYDDDALKITWKSPRDARARLAGRAYFMPLGTTACLMHYELAADLPATSVPTWENPFVGGSAASMVVNDFRDHIERNFKK